MICVCVRARVCAYVLTQLDSWPILTRQNENIDPTDNKINIVISSTLLCKYFIWLMFFKSFACVFELRVLISSMGHISAIFVCI